MRSIGRNICILFIVFCCSIRVGQAQDLRREEIEAAVVKISNLIKSNYVFEERGKKIAARLLQIQRDGKFDSVKSWDEFAALCTRILQDDSDDGHLYVRRDAKTVKELAAATNQAGKPVAEDPFFHGQEARVKNFGFEEVKVLQGNIGYVKLSEINISEVSLPTMFAAMEFVAHTKALILDLRGNKGGGSEVGPVLESLFLPKNTPLLEFRSRNGQVTSEKTVAWLTQKKYSRPLFIIIDRKTASAAEALTFALQAKKRALVVGQPSAGAANMNSWYVVNNDVFVSVSVEAPTLAGTDTSWEKRGIRPDYTVAEGDEIKYIMQKVSEN